MRIHCPHNRAQRISAVVAALFGLATLFAGGRVLFGLGDAGYVVVPAVLLFNTVMGFFYLLAAVLIVRSVETGRVAAGAIAIVNLAVWTLIMVHRASGGTVANETVGAMTLRTIVWVAIFAVISRSLRRSLMEAPARV
jgi:hypothetical protein